MITPEQEDRILAKLETLKPAWRRFFCSLSLVFLPVAVLLEYSLEQVVISTALGLLVAFFGLEFPLWFANVLRERAGQGES